ncbi:MAG: DnaA N-terminal domain-containing protein [Anaerolineae bacterium]
MMIKSIVSQPVFSPLVAAPDKLWPLVLADLRQQMTKATFNTWLVDSRILTATSTLTFWVVVVRNEYAYEWLTNRLAPVIERTLVGLVGSEVIICYVPRTMRSRHRESFRRPPARIACDAAEGKSRAV